jgi:hypothetical protein
MRRRVAAGQLTKSKKGIGAQIKANNAKLAASPLGQFADTLLGFALPVGKVKAAAAAFRSRGSGFAMSQLESRVMAKEFGKQRAKEIASGVPASSTYNYGLGPISRVASSNLYPKYSPPKPTTPAQRIVDNPRWGRPARPKVKPLPIPKGTPPDASKMLPAPRPMLPARRGTPPDASKMLPPRKPRPSTKALRDYRSTGRPPSKPGSMEGWQGIQNVRKGGR